MGWINDPTAWLGLLTLTLLEIVLGIDNLVFITIVAGKVEPSRRAQARQWGLGLAVITRILFLLSIGMILKLEKPLLHLAGKDLSGRDLILLAGGLFLIYKAVHEIHAKLEGDEQHASSTPAKPGAKSAMAMVIAQILVVDLVFSIDSVVTAVGMVKQIEVMILAVIISVGIMLVFVNSISNFVEKHPSIKMLALSFLILIGMNLVLESFHIEIPHGYTYFAMGFSLVVEMLNLKLRSKSKPVELRHNYPVDPSETPAQPDLPPEKSTTER